MYKRKKRRANKGKKKLSVSTSPSPTPTVTTTSTTTGWTDDNKIARTTETATTNDIMSVTTMEVAENHHHHHQQSQQQQQQQQAPRQTSLKISTATVNSKAVGARKRKPMQISKIVEKLPAMTDHPLDFGAEKNLVHSNNNNNSSNNNNNNSPPYKKPCLEMSKNGIIKNILSELKTAKMGGSRGEAIDMSKRISREDDEDVDIEEDEDHDDDPSDTAAGLCVKGEDAENEDEYADEEEGDDDEEEEEDEEEEGIDLSGNEEAKLLSNNNNNSRGRQNIYTNPSLKQRFGVAALGGMVDMGSTSPRQQRGGGPSRDKTDLAADVKSILSSPGVNKRDVSSPNGWDRNKYGDDDDDSANDEGADLRSITGNSTGDDELPFRCGVCAYGSCDKSTLLRHMRTHSGERPFQCRLCYFAFTTKANCERHLRNRHGQIDRDQLRNLVVCLPTSSNASESETEGNSNGGSNGGGSGGAVSTQQSGSAAASAESSGRKRATPPTSAVEENEMPLDLSMDAVDLSTKHRDGGNPIFRRRASIPRPRPLYATTEIPNALVTSPFISKREPMVHPQIPLNPFSPQSIPKAGPMIGGHPTHPAFSLFPFGGPAPFNPFAIPSANVEKLISLGSSSPPRMPNPFMATASSNTNLESREAVAAPEKEVKVKSEPPVQETKRAGSQTKSTSSSSASPTTTGRKKGDNTNGEYQKPKQRRYRTERPFACPHCPARFTLRSNMERHGKHQHPTVWQRSPSNRVINRQKNQQMSPLVGPPTLVHPNKYTSGLGAELTKDKGRDASVNVNVRAVIAQQLKRKLSNSSLRNNNNGSETETDPENTPALEIKSSSGGDTSSDLASVSQLLDRVKSSNFAQYFNETESQNLANDNNNSDDDGEGDESGEENASSEEGDTKVVGGVEKKKSAYSSAPHKISCPHCTRRFPWTSSLRRHLLTHTGQKPFQCSKCPLLFTTKSNCDRHLARKHSDNANNSSKGASDSNNNSDSEDEDEEDGVEGEDENEEVEQSDATPTVVKTTASVTPSSGGTGGTTAGAETTTPNSGRNTSSSSTHNSTVSKTPSNGSALSSPGEDAAFRCHLCEAAAGEREALLTHMEEQHKETFHLLVSKGALSSSPPSENSENEQTQPTDQRDVTHRKVMCVFCIRRFWSVEDLRRHIRSHSGERPFSCPHCSRRFTLKHSMLRHLKKHSSTVTPSRKLVKASSKDVTNSASSGPSGRVGPGGKTGDLIGRLLGLNDEKLVEKLLSQPDANDAAKILGLGGQQQQQQMQTSTRATSKVN